MTPKLVAITITLPGEKLKEDKDVLAAKIAKWLKENGYELHDIDAWDLTPEQAGAMLAVSDKHPSAAFVLEDTKPKKQH